jgi:thiosulfate reductase cytochrome b subunit
MASSGSAHAVSAAVAPIATSVRPRHAVLVRATHWISAVCFFALLVTGIEVLISHPRFYWGETGTVLSKPLFQLPIPSSRSLVQTGYGYVMPDQNGWSRALHFQSAWLLVLTGLLYALFGFFSGHFRKELIPSRTEFSFRAIGRVIACHLRFERPTEAELQSYNVLQRLTYMVVLVVLFPLIIWTGLAMSPAFTSAFPASVILLGGRQSARTIHFFVTLALTLFLLVHVAMVWRAGFWRRVKAMITGNTNPPAERI